MKDKFSDYIDFSISERTLSKTVNQDYIITHKSDFGQLYILSDGVGISEGADLASQMTALCIKEYFDQYLKENNLKECFSKAVVQANQKLIEYVVSHHYLTGLGASLLLVFIKRNTLYYTIIGDCKLYLIRNKQIEVFSNPFNEFDNSNPRILGSSSLRPGNIHSFLLYQDDLLLLGTNSVGKHFTRIELLKYATIFHFDNLKLNLLEFYRSKQGRSEISLIAIKVNNGNKKPVELVDEKEMKKKLIIAILVFALSLTLFLHTYLPIIFNNFTKIPADKYSEQIDSTYTDPDRNQNAHSID